MQYIIEKIGMSRTIGASSTAVTLLKVIEAKVCEVSENNTAIIAYSESKNLNKAIEGQQAKYGISKEFNKFMTIDVVEGTVAGDLSTDALSKAKVIKTSLNTKGRGFTGAMKRHNFSGGPGAHGHRFKRLVGSIGNREWPGRVQKGKKMAGQYGNTRVTVKNDVLSFDAENNILVVKGAVPGHNGARGMVRIVKWVI